MIETHHPLSSEIHLKVTLNLSSSRSTATSKKIAAVGTKTIPAGTAEFDANS
jgi:hypothetical protein